MTAGVVACLSLALPAQVAPSSASDHQWQQVQKLTHGAQFTFVDRDLKCATGRIHSVNGGEVVVRMKTGDVKLEKRNVLLVTNVYWNFVHPPQAAVRAALYSGRSSWSDVMQLGGWVRSYSRAKLRMEVTTADGKLHGGNLADVTESGIALTEGDKDVSVAKADVSRIAFVREKPLNDSREYNLDELGPLVIFDPDAYLRLFHIGDTMSVRLYDSSMPEDNSPIACK